MPAVAVIGGVGVTIRLATVEHGHRATVDVDVVADDRDPPAVQVLARDRHRLRDQTAVVASVEIDVIPTQPVSEEALREIEDHGARLFVGAHRWRHCDVGAAHRRTFGHRCDPPAGRITCRPRRGQGACRWLRASGAAREQAWRRPVRHLPPAGGVRRSGRCSS